MSDILEQRRRSSWARLDEFKSDLTDAARIAVGKACVYATGSFARGDASEYSDLDIFIIGRGSKDARALRRLDEISIKADLIELTKKHRLPPFSGDGRYLVHYTVDELIKTLGHPEDDATNTFTARLLLLLESRPIIGEDVYSEAVDGVVTAYWRDYQDHKTDFIPAFLANDILRLWRTFCVNYEARTETNPEIEKARRKLKNYKLKNSRLLTCYSALVYLLAIHRITGTVSPADAYEMVKLSPTQRLEWLLQSDPLAASHGYARDMLHRYEVFLKDTDATEDELVQRFLDPEKSREMLKRAYEFGDAMFSLVESVGDAPATNRFFRMLLV